MIGSGGSDGVYGPLKEWILALPGVEEAAHRFGGTEFRVRGVEFMHSHRPSFLDIRLSKSDQALVLKEGKAQHHQAYVHHQAGWVSFRVLSEADAERVKELIGLAYGRARRAVEPHEGQG